MTITIVKNMHINWQCKLKQCQKWTSKLLSDRSSFDYLPPCNFIYLGNLPWKLKKWFFPFSTAIFTLIYGIWNIIIWPASCEKGRSVLTHRQKHRKTSESDVKIFVSEQGVESNYQSVKIYIYPLFSAIMNGKGKWIRSRLEK